MVAGIIGVESINSTEVTIVTVDWLTCPIAGVTRLPRRTDFRGIHTGMGGRIDAIRSTEVPIVTTCWFTSPIAEVTRLPRRTDFRGILAGIIGVDAINSTEVIVVTV